MRLLNTVVLAAVVCASLAACGSASPSAVTGASPASAAPHAPASPAAVSTSAQPAKAAESIGAAFGQKIAFFAAAKAAGMTDSAQMDALAVGVCQRIASGHAQSVGPWLADTFKLHDSAAALVAVSAIKYKCPQYAAQVGAR